jgi:hypothetical protein
MNVEEGDSITFAEVLAVYILHVSLNFFETAHGHVTGNERVRNTG